MNFDQLLENTNQIVHRGIIFEDSITLTLLLYFFMFVITFVIFATFVNFPGGNDFITNAFWFALLSNVIIIIIISIFNYGHISDTKKEAYIQEYLNTEENYTKESIENYSLKGNQVEFTLKDGTYVSLPAKNVKYDLKDDETPYYSYVEFKKEIKGEKTHKKGKHNETVHLPKNEK